MLGLKKYTREILILLLGAATILCITLVTNRHGKQKELKKKLDAVKVELIDNLREIDRYIKLFDDTNILADIFRSGRKWEDIPKIERIDLYESPRGSIYFFSYKRDAFDMLKACENISLLKDKKLISDIDACYEMMELVKQEIQDYMKLKSDVMWKNYQGDMRKNLSLVDEFIMNTNTQPVYFSLVRNKTLIENILSNRNF